MSQKLIPDFLNRILDRELFKFLVGSVSHDIFYISDTLKRLFYIIFNVLMLSVCSMQAITYSSWFVNSGIEYFVSYFLNNGRIKCLNTLSALQCLVSSFVSMFQNSETFLLYYFFATLNIKLFYKFFYSSNSHMLSKPAPPADMKRCNRLCSINLL